MRNEISIFSGNANRPLAERICQHLGVELGEARIGRFSDGESRIQIGRNVRGRDVFLIQPTCAPVNDHLMELLIMAEAARRASAGRITAVVPYFGYARQDRKVAPREPITARLVADLMTAAGIDRVLTMDLHAGQIQGFFQCPVDNLYALPLLVGHLRLMIGDQPAVVVSPDSGGVERARAVAKRLGATLAIIDKRRSRPNESEVQHLIGDVTDRVAIIVDDMVDTAGTLTKAAVAVSEAGARSVIAASTHGVFSGPALERLTNSPIEKMLVTDTIPLNEKMQGLPLFEIQSVSSLLGDAISAIHNDESISRLFREPS